MWEPQFSGWLLLPKILSTTKLAEAAAPRSNLTILFVQTKIHLPGSPPCATIARKQKGTILSLWLVCRQTPELIRPGIPTSSKSPKKALPTQQTYSAGKTLASI